jgi:hypothetical protein
MSLWGTFLIQTITSIIWKGHDALWAQQELLGPWELNSSHIPSSGNPFLSVFFFEITTAAVY